MIITDLDWLQHTCSRNGLAICYHGSVAGIEVPHMSPPWADKNPHTIPNWATGKRSEREIANLRAHGWLVELRYDAAHGRRYGAVIYPGTIGSIVTARRVALAAFDGIHNLRQHAIDCGISESELLA